VPLDEYLPDAKGMLGYVRGFAEGFGVEGLQAPERLESTRRALAVAQLARREGRLDAWREAAFDAYWRGGRGIESDGELRDLARAAGLDGDAAVAAARDPALLAEVDAARVRARGAGVTGIPTFEFVPEPAAPHRSVRVVGCQPYEVLAEAARRAGARRRG
jgi:predicted DsbA family dithiol-disulfide isomerase